MSNILTNPAGNISLELKDDRLSAWLTIARTGQLASEREILELIDKAGIKNGFDEAARYMRRQGLEKEFDTPFPIALCQRGQGEASLNYYFNVEQAEVFTGHLHPEDLPLLTCIEAGTVIADFGGNIFQRQGSIYDIFGEMLPDEALDQQSLSQLTGDNVDYDHDRQQFVALATGFAQLAEDGRISIIDRITLDEDLADLEPGLLSPVALEISGSVRNTQITAAGSVTIHGDLVNAGVYCQGGLAVKGTIQDCVQPGLEIGGSVNCAQIVNSRVLCRGRVAFEGAILHSEIYADGGISSSAGLLCGGHLESGGDVDVDILGDEQGAATELELTISPFNKALLMQLTKELIRRKQDTASGAELIETLNARIQSCELELDSELNDYLKRFPRSRLRLSVRHRVLPPVQIRILKHEYQIKTPQATLELEEKD